MKKKIKMCKIKVTYKVEERINADMDETIKKQITGIGGKWYAQGMNTRTGIRDICFDMEIE